MRYQSRMHPTLDILCDSMGRVFLPATSGHAAHWTFGYMNKSGYRTVCIDRKKYLVARLICEAFHGLAPKDRPTCDHIDRNRERNVPENLRWASAKTQADNTANVINRSDYGVRCCEDRNAYQRAKRARNPEFAERDRVRCREWKAKNIEHTRAYQRERYAKQKALRLAAKEN